MRDDEPGTDPRRLVQTGRWRGLLVIVALVLVALTVTLVLAGDGDPSPGPAAADPTTVSTTVPTTTDEWRTEAWRGVQVRVPAGWAVGGSPQADGGSAGLVQCGGATQADTGPVGEGAPYVGRPLVTSDVCLLVDPDDLPEPTAPYIWLGSPVAEGALTWGNGYTSETVEVGDQRVSVATDDAALRAEILASVEAVGTDDHGCPQNGRGRGTPRGALTGPPERLAICVYDAVGLGSGLDWSGEAGAGAAADLVESLAGVSDPVDCRHRRDEQWAVLLAEGGGGSAAYVVDFRCGLVRLPRTTRGDDPVARLRPENVEPWALAGVRAYVRGPAGDHPGLAPYFRGLLG